MIEYLLLGVGKMAYVKLVQYTPNPDLFCAKIARYTRTTQIWDELKAPRGGWKEFLRRIIKLGHTSVLEHATFTYEISKVSRVMTHQLVRHRIASYAQKSHRALKVKRVIVTPSAVEAFKKLNASWDESYRILLKQGVPVEDARYLAPFGAETAIIVTMNARELHDSFFPLRLATDAQWEIRQVANEMLKLAKEKAPVIFDKFKTLEL